jgi:hypothetical protein
MIESKLGGFAPIGIVECWNSGIMGESKRRIKVHTIALLSSL